MREILFRGKRMEDGKWIEGFLIMIGKEAHIQYCAPGFRIIGSDEVDPETVGQYVGKKDKNRKKIFEADIVQAIKTGFDPPRKYRKPYQVHYNSDFPSAVDEYYSPFEHFTEKIAYEVIGNIHDNPELLENP